MSTPEPEGAPAWLSCLIIIGLLIATGMCFAALGTPIALWLAK